MGFFDALKEKLRDKTRDEVSGGLCAIGVDARMVERGRPEENVRGSWKGGKSLGLIEIRGSPIRWVNILRAESGAGTSITVAHNIVYLVPDPTVGCRGYRRGESVRVKSAPVSGRVVDLRWKGNFEADLIGKMNEDTLLKQSLIELEEDIQIRSHPEHGCWAMWSKTWLGLPFPPSRERWDCYETIARHLLEPSGYE